MTAHTYTRTMIARYGDNYVIVPDGVADDQRAWADSMSPFPAIPCLSTGAPISGFYPVFVWLDGNAYGLGTPGTGDMIVRDAEIDAEVVRESVIPAGYADKHGRFFGRAREDGNVVVLHHASGEAATRLDASVYPVGSNQSARYEHPEGIVLTREDADKIGLVVE